MSDLAKQAVLQAQADYSYRQRRNFAIFQLGLWVEGVLRGRTSLGLVPHLIKVNQWAKVLQYLQEVEAQQVRIATLEAWVDRDARGKLKALLEKELEVAKEQTNKVKIGNLLQENSDLIRGLIAAKVPRKRVAFLVSQATGVAVSDRVLAKFLSGFDAPQPAPEPAGETAAVNSEVPTPKSTLEPGESPVETPPADPEIKLELESNQNNYIFGNQRIGYG